jgi:Flp pilus assembly protein TadD
MDSHNRKELTMKRLITILATVSLVFAVSAPIASAKHLGSKASSKASAKQTVRQGKQPGKKIAVHVAKHMRGF